MAKKIETAARTGGYPRSETMDLRQRARARGTSSGLHQRGRTRYGP
jgi:hypothetical protein